MTRKEEFELYGRYLNGSETDLVKAKLARARYLKLKMRPRLAADIGDDPDTITDILRAVLLSQAINIGLVTDEAIIARMGTYIGEMLAGYGGAEACMDILEYDKQKIGEHVLMQYFVAKAAIDQAEDEDAVRRVDLPGEPSGEDLV